jgi:hypothetical protein
MGTLEPDSIDPYDSLFIASRGADVPLSCPARVRAEVERGHRVAVLALFEPLGDTGPPAEAVGRLGARYLGCGLTSARERRSTLPALSAGVERGPEDEEAVSAAAHLLARVGPRTRAVHVHGPLGLGPSVDHQLAYEASVRAFGREAGINLFLYEERPEAFVPGAVRTRLALLGARLPPAGVASAPRAGLLSVLRRVNEPRRLRGEAGGLGARFRAWASARRRWRAARAWNPLRAFGPRLQPIVLPADEEARDLGREAAALLLPADRKGRPRSARRFSARADAAARALGAVYHAERLWLVLPSNEPLPGLGHPLDDEG